MVDHRTPLDGCPTPLQSRDDAGDESGTLRIGHGPVGTLVQVSGWAPDFQAAVSPALESLGLDGLGEFNQAQIGTDCVCFRTAPNRLLIWQHERGNLNAELNALDPSASPVLDLSHARVRLTIEGSQSQDIMACLSTIDFRDRAFPNHAFAQTEIHHTSCLIFRPQSGTYELLTPSSYARSMWDFVCDVARPFGLRADVFNSGSDEQ